LPLDKTTDKAKEEANIVSCAQNSLGTWETKNLQDSFISLLPPNVQKIVRERENIPLLPEWPDNTRGVPNICLRSALFGVIRRGRRRAVKGESVAAVKGLDIRYTGWRLDQGDFDVMAHALHLVAKYSQNATTNGFVQFTAKGFLRGIGRKHGKSGREWLKDSFRRLTASALEIKLEDSRKPRPNSITYVGSLIDEFYYNAHDQTYSLKVNPKLAGIFETGWTQLQWQQRLNLKTDLAKWLHGFYSSHRSPYPIKVATLMRLCGSECYRLVDYRRSLRAAMNEINRVGAISAWKIDQEDKVHVNRLPIGLISE